MRGEREGLLDLLHGIGIYDEEVNRAIASTLLASAWFAKHNAAIEKAHGERIARAIEKANRKEIDRRVADIEAKPHVVDRSLTYAANIARTTEATS